MRKICVLVLCAVFILICYTSCFPLFSSVEPKKTIEVYNPTSESVQIKCYWLDESEPETSTISAYGRRTYKLGSYVRSGTEITIFGAGTYYYYASQKVSVYGSSTSVTLKPNCSYIKIVNRTSSTISSVSIGTKYVNINPTTMMPASDTIYSGGAGAIRCTSSFSGYIEFFYNGSSYMTTSLYFSPSFGSTTTINIYSSSIRKR